MEKKFLNYCHKITVETVLIVYALWLGIKCSALLYETDRMRIIKSSKINSVSMSVYLGVLKGKVNKLLHLKYNWKG